MTTLILLSALATPGLAADGTQMLTGAGGLLLVGGMGLVTANGVINLNSGCREDERHGCQWWLIDMASPYLVLSAPLLVAGPLLTRRREGLQSPNWAGRAGLLSLSAMALSVPFMFGDRSQGPATGAFMVSWGAAEVFGLIQAGHNRGARRSPPDSTVAVSFAPMMGASKGVQLSVRF